jgi:hypothetical protein
MPQVLERPAQKPEERPMIPPSLSNSEREAVNTRFILAKLAEAETYAARPDAKWYTWEEFWADDESGE